MKSIGIRVEPKEIHYTIVENKKDSQGSIGYYYNKLVVPISMQDDIPRQLSFIRTNLWSIICEYDIRFAGLRTYEAISSNPNVFRINVEGVIQELFSYSTIEKYYTGGLRTIASRLGVNISHLKECSAGNIDLFEVDWESVGKNKNKRESVLAGLAAQKFNAKEDHNAEN